MPKFQVSKSIIINAPAEKVFAILNNFSQWRAWSPWLIQDPEAKVNLIEGNKAYFWEGPRSGTGSMKIVKEAVNKSIDYKLEFLKPWKSKADVRFDVFTIDNGTKVTWSMDSALPFFMFWMKKMMVALVGLDYKRGLLLLKDFVEDEKVHSQLDFNGYSTVEGCRYIGIKTACTTDEIATKMDADFSKLMDFVGKEEAISAEKPFTIYHKWDLVSGKVAYTCAVKVNNMPLDLPNDFVIGDRPTTKVYTVKHTGPYHHMGNAWSALYGMAQRKELAENKSINPFEIYLNSPKGTPENELETEVHFPVKNDD
jgi:effector-binding domain-containing protein